jgi:hypothetical protein
MSSALLAFCRREAWDSAMKRIKLLNPKRAEYIEAAHMVEADHDEPAFEKRLIKISKEKPQAKPAQKLRTKSKPKSKPKKARRKKR